MERYTTALEALTLLDLNAAVADKLRGHLRTLAAYLRSKKLTRWAQTLEEESAVWEAYGRRGFQTRNQMQRTMQTLETMLSELKNSRSKFERGGETKSKPSFHEILRRRFVETYVLVEEMDRRRGNSLDRILEVTEAERGDPILSSLHEIRIGISAIAGEAKRSFYRLLEGAGPGSLRGFIQLAQDILGNVDRRSDKQYAKSPWENVAGGSPRGLNHRKDQRNYRRISESASNEILGLSRQRAEDRFAGPIPEVSTRNVAFYRNSTPLHTMPLIRIRERLKDTLGKAPIHFEKAVRDSYLSYPNETMLALGGMSDLIIKDLIHSSLMNSKINSLLQALPKSQYPFLLQTIAWNASREVLGRKNAVRRILDRFDVGKSWGNRKNSLENLYLFAGQQYGLEKIVEDLRYAVSQDVSWDVVKSHIRVIAEILPMLPRAEQVHLAAEMAKLADLAARWYARPRAIVRYSSNGILRDILQIIASVPLDRELFLYVDRFLDGRLVQTLKESGASLEFRPRKTPETVTTGFIQVQVPPKEFTVLRFPEADVEASVPSKIANPAQTMLPVPFLSPKNIPAAVKRIPRIP